MASTFKRNPNFWETGSRYVNEVVVTDYADETSLTNALLLKGRMRHRRHRDASVPTVKNGGQVVVYSNAGGSLPSRCDAIKRPSATSASARRCGSSLTGPQMRELVFGGHGLLGNDVTSPFDPAYDKSLPQRVQDIPKAKFLLKAAGHENLKVTLVTSPIQQGAVSAATILAQQAKAANVNVVLQTVPTSEFYGPNYLKWTFAEDFYFYSPYMLQATDRVPPDVTVQRDPLRRGPLQQPVRQGPGDHDAVGRDPGRAGDDADRLQPGRVHHPLLQPRD